MATQRNFKGYLGLVARGIAMGTADVIPGVSGGTIAFITGIYAELLETISSIRLNLITTWRANGFAAAWREANLNFLVALLLGIAIAVVSLANAISYLMQNQEQLLWAFFFGLVLASIFLVGRDVKKWSAPSIVAFVLGVGAALFITALPPMAALDFPGFLFVAGMIAICAMILPGISGSFLLLILGAYHDVIDAIKSFDIKTIALFGAGCITGILGFSRVLNWMYKRYTDLTISLLTGFMLGSLPKIWPWQAKVELLNTHSDGREDWLRANILPNEVAGDPQILGVVLCLTAGCVVILLLSRLAQTKA